MNDINHSASVTVPVMTIGQAQNHFASLLTKGESASLDEITKDDLIRTEEILASLKSQEELLKKLLEQWWICLSQNNDYKDYCEAQRTQNITVINQLEAKYPGGDEKGVAQVYQDWGDICQKGYDFDEWLKSRKHLFFMPERVIAYATNGSQSEQEVLIRMPKGIVDKNELWTLFSQFLNKHYLVEHGAYCPSYQVSGRVSVGLYQKIEMAAMVHELVKFEDEEQDKMRDRLYSTSQIVQTIMFNPYLRYLYGVDSAWQRDASTLESKFKKNGIPLTVDEITSKKPYILELKKFYKECIAKSICGVFPS